MNIHSSFAANDGKVHGLSYFNDYQHGRTKIISNLFHQIFIDKTILKSNGSSKFNTSKNIHKIIW